MIISDLLLAFFIVSLYAISWLFGMCALIDEKLPQQNPETFIGLNPEPDALNLKKQATFADSATP